MLATEIGANAKVAKRAGLLHDIGKAVDHEVDGTHVSIGVELAKKYKESDAVIHCIQAHHNDVEPQTLEAVLVQAADTISSARPGARRESLENYIKRLEQLENRKARNDVSTEKRKFQSVEGQKDGIINELLAKINALTPAEGEALLTVPTGSSE